MFVFLLCWFCCCWVGFAARSAGFAGDCANFAASRVGFTARSAVIGAVVLVLLLLVLVLLLLVSGLLLLMSVLLLLCSFFCCVGFAACRCLCLSANLSVRFEHSIQKILTVLVRDLVQKQNLSFVHIFYYSKYKTSIH